MCIGKNNGGTCSSKEDLETIWKWYIDLYGDNPEGGNMDPAPEITKEELQSIIKDTKRGKANLPAELLNTYQKTVLKFSGADTE